VVLLGGAVRRTGLVDVPRSIGLGELIQTVGGGPCRGRFLGARVGDSTAAYVSPVDADTTLSDLLDRGIDPSAVLVLDEDCCVLDVLAHDLEALAGESCGKCPSCRVGLAVLSRRIERIERGAAGGGEPAATAAWAVHVRDTALCRLGKRAARSVATVLDGFPEAVLSHLRGDGCG
jgi:NADH:ubiquinone oxidoreductase subunit F (NADH-binding)